MNEAPQDCKHDLQAIAAIEFSDKELELAASMCQAMADPSRLKLLLWLQQGERCVSELVELEQAKLSSISARLQLLYSARLVSRRREAKHVFYRLADAHVRNLLGNILHHAAEPIADAPLKEKNHEH